MSDQNAFLDLSRFKKLEKIGKGSFGKVYIVKEKATGIIYAGKISISSIKEEQNDNEVKPMITNLQREININAQLDHPSILKFIGYSPVNFSGKPYPVIITEYSQNGALSSIIKLERQSLSPKEWNDTKKLINIFGIASAMAFLHSNNIIHRDLKPDNILEDDYLFPKICDFGLSKIFHTNKESMTVQSMAGIKGTPIYIPPETWSTNEYSKSGDVYAFGLIVYEIMTLEEPLKDFTLPRILSQVVIQGYRPEINDTIPECYKNLIINCWLQNPEERPTFDEIVSELKDNEEFIYETIDKDEYFDYVEFIESSKSEFDRSKKYKKITRSKMPIKINETEKNEKGKKKIKEKKDKKDKKEKKESNKKKDDDINISDDKELNDFEKICKMPSFDKISQETRDFIIELLTQENHVPKTITFLVNQTPIIYKNNDFNSQDFISIMKYFDSIFFEIKYPLKKFEDIIDIIANLVDTQLPAISLRIIPSKFDPFRYMEKLKKIPLYIRINKKVENIEDNAFLGCSSLKEVIIPSSVNRIGDNVFQNCTSLEQITIPSSVSDIGNSVFSGCKLLTKISIPSEVYVGHSTFMGCSSLTEAPFLSSLNELYQTYCGCSSLTQVVIPFSVETISDHAFRGCSSLTQIKIPSSVNEIKGNAFEGCSSLTKMIIPSSVKDIGAFAFKGCTSLSEITLPTILDSFGPHMFEDCTSLIEINLPFIKVIEYNTFYGCSSLKHITIPTSVYFIGKAAFFGCSSLEQLDIPSTVNQIDSSAFDGCSSLKELTIPSSVDNIDSNLFKRCFSLTNVIIPLSVIYIGPSSFAGCSSLTKISIPPKVIQIDDYAFSQCTSLKEITIPSSVTTIGN